MQMKGADVRVLIGIAGATASGKTAVTQGLAERYAVFGVALFDQDSYYHDRSRLTPEGRAQVN